MMKRGNLGWRAVLLCVASLAFAAHGTEKDVPILLPAPRQIELKEGLFSPPKNGTIALSPRVDDALLRIAQSAQKHLQGQGGTWELRAVAPAALDAYPAAISIAPELCPQNEGYTLKIAPDRLSITAHDVRGVFYAIQTIKQLARQSRGGLPCVEIADWPDIPNRGVMLDISRNKVPKMETLFQLVDFFAEMKFNQIQLYMEHTFAYRGHETAWQEFSPMTPEQVLALDAYCRERFIELAPNQNSFAHLEWWLKHDRYKGLAENPAAPFTLNPVDPQAIEFLGGLYDDLLPNFTSANFNVGCDETDLGNGKSKEACAKQGVARVYFDFLMKVHELVKQRGHTMQFWADIIFNHPELIPELPKDVTAMLWGYEADHPYANQTQRMKEVGVPFYVCPGTSSWNCLLGRTDNMIGNMRNAAENGTKNGARGLLVTDWGDGGHWQYLPISFAGYAYAAALSWSFDANRNLDLARALDAHVFQDEAGVMGQFALDLGNTYKENGKLLGNEALPALLLYSHGLPSNDKEFKGIKRRPLEKSIKAIGKLLTQLEKSEMRRGDAQLVVDEFKNNAAMAIHGLRLGIARLSSKELNVAQLPANERAELAADLGRIIAEHRRLWLERNREGGLQYSTKGLEALLAAYKTP